MQRHPDTHTHQRTNFWKLLSLTLLTPLIVYLLGVGMVQATLTLDSTSLTGDGNLFINPAEGSKIGLGIRTTPSSTIHASGTTYIQGGSTLTTPVASTVQISAGNIYLPNAGTVHFGNAAGTSFQPILTRDSTNFVKIRSGGGISVFTLDTSHRVGIGNSNTSPSTVDGVDGSIVLYNATTTAVTSVTIRAGSGQGASSTLRIQDNAGGNLLNFSSSGLGLGVDSPSSVLHVSGTARLSSGLTLDDGLTLTTGTISLTASSGSVALTLTSSTTAFNINNVLNIDSTNNRVGIAKNNPATALDVNGLINASTGYTLSTNNAILMSSNFLQLGSGFTNGIQGTYITGGPIDQVKHSTVFVEPNATTEKLFVLRGIANQTANLQEWQNSTGGILKFVDASGNVGIGAGIITASSTLHVSSTMRLQPRASAPSSPASGDIYVDSTPTPDELCFYDGAAWQGISSGTDANCA